MFTPQAWPGVYTRVQNTIADRKQHILKPSYIFTMTTRHVDHIRSGMQMDIFLLLETESISSTYVYHVSSRYHLFNQYKYLKNDTKHLDQNRVFQGSSSISFVKYSFPTMPPGSCLDGNK